MYVYKCCTCMYALCEESNANISIILSMYTAHNITSINSYICIYACVRVCVCKNLSLSYIYRYRYHVNVIFVTANHCVLEPPPPRPDPPSHHSAMSKELENMLKIHDVLSGNCFPFPSTVVASILVCYVLLFRFCTDLDWGEGGGYCTEVYGY